MGVVLGGYAQQFKNAMNLEETAAANRKFATGLAILTLLALILRVYGLSDIPPTDDDLSVISSAVNYMERGHFGTTMWHHPKLRNIFVYYLLDLFGWSNWGLKGVSLTLGCLTVPAIGLVAKRIFNSGSVGLLAALFVAVDTVHIDFSRQAIQEVYMPFFCLAAIYAALIYADGDHPLSLVLSGLSFGLGIAAKWYVLFPLAVTSVFLCIKSLRREETAAGEKLIESFFILSALIVLPLLVYLVTYFPWFYHRGYSLWEFMSAQRIMYAENLIHKGYNPYLLEADGHPSHWFIHPVAWVDFFFAEGKPWVLLALLNPVVCFATLPAVCYLFYRGVKDKNMQFLYLFALFCVSYLPLIATDRPIWLNTAYAVVPFAFMAIAYLILKIVKMTRHGRLFLAVYITAVVVTSLPLYLLAIGKGYEIELLRPLVESYRPANEK